MKNNNLTLIDGVNIKYHKIGTRVKNYIFDKFYKNCLLIYKKSELDNKLIYSNDETGIVVNSEFPKLINTSQTLYNNFVLTCSYFDLINKLDNNDIYISNNMHQFVIENFDLEEEIFEKKFYEFLLEVWNEKIKNLISYFKNKEKEEDEDLDQDTSEYITTFSLLVSNSLDEVGFSSKLEKLGNFNYTKADKEYWEIFKEYLNKNSSSKLVREIKDNVLKIISITHIDEKVKSIEETFNWEVKEKIKDLWLNRNWVFSDKIDVDFDVDKIEQKNVSVNDYFTELMSKTSFINVPIYQRNYVWNFEMIKILLEDICNIKNTKKQHFISNVIFIKKSTELGYTHNIIIDGQQRTTTLILISFAIYIYYINIMKNNSPYNIKIPRILSEMFNYQYGFLDKFINLSDSKSYELFSALINLDISQFVDEHKDNLLKNNLIEIYTWIKNEFAGNDVGFEEFVGIFFNHIILNKILLPDSNGYTYFEKLNTLGIKLNDLDLLKSLFYSYFKEVKKIENEERIKRMLNNVEYKILKHFRKSQKQDVDTKKLEHFTKFLLFEKGYEKRDIDKLMKSNISWIFKAFQEILYNDKNKEYIIDDLSYLSTVYNLITSKDIDTFETMVNELKGTIKNGNYLKLLFHFIFSVTQGTKRTIYTNLIYNIIKPFILGDKEWKFSEIIEWLFELQRFNFIWKTAFFSGDSLQLQLNQISELLKNGSITTIEKFRNELYHLSLFNENSFSQINKALKFELKNESNNKKLQKRVKAEKLEILFNINYYLLLKNITDEYVFPLILSHANQLYINKSSYESLVTLPASNKKMSPELEKIISREMINSIGNGMISNSNTNNKKNIDYANEYNITINGYDLTKNQTLDKWKLEKIVQINDENDDISDNGIEILVDVNQYVSQEKEIVLETLKKREKQIINIIWNIYKIPE